MKKYRLFVNAVLAAVMGLGLTASVFAQKIALPSGLTEGSSVEQILQWIDKTSFAEARIGLESNASGAEPGDIPTSGTGYYQWAFFSKGFRLSKIEGCKLTLKNDDVKLLRLISDYPNPADGSLNDFTTANKGQSQFIGEITIPLQKLKANKSPYRYTKKPQETALLGTWRTEFKMKFDFFLIPTKKNVKSLFENALEIEITGGQNGISNSMGGDELTFTFDDQQTSKDFYAAFSRALTLCKDK